tara:strand:- start:41 stop:1930 length:1890 start_codon:yes stop_codon:yes gene_type:complete
MKKITLLLLMVIAAVGAFAQKAATSPGTGHWVVIDSGYQVATNTIGKTVAPLYFHNTSTVNKITGMQFRVFYDKAAFASVVPSLKISATDQYLQYVDDNTSGFLTVTVVYTGTNSSFNYANGSTFDLTFTHVAEAAWNVLDSVKSLKVSGVSSFPNVASTNMGNDTTLTVYSYGGRFNQKMLRFAGKFINTTGTNAKNLWVSLEKKSPTGSWTTVLTQKTNNTGVVVFYKNIDTSYWDVRMAIKGDTMTPGSVFSTADAQKINQAVLGQYAVKGFDFYSMDVNGADGNVTIADVYSVYGRLAGRFTSWPNSQNDIKFFTVSEYNTIAGSGTNYTSTIAGLTNFYYYVDGKDSITYYVNVKGDANGTGFKMARLTPIKITNPSNAKDYIIDNTVQYDNVFEGVEVNMPKVKVDQGNLVNIPVKIITGGKQLGAVQLELKYDTALLQFAKIDLTEKMMNWTSYINPDNGIIAFGAADLKGDNLINDGDNILTLQFIAKKPQDQWGTASIWTGPKFVGGNDARDMNVTPAMGIVEVKKIKQPIRLGELDKFIVFPNPNDGMVAIEFTIKEESNTELNVSDLVGRKVLEILNTKMPQGKYNYIVNLTNLDNGLYLISLKTDYNIQTSKIIINK